MNRIILITGDKNSGKTSFIKHFIDQVVSKEKLPYGGFIAEGIFKSGKKSGFDLVELNRHDKKLLCTNIPKKGWIKMDNFYFDPEGFRFGEDILFNLAEETKWIVIDEYGPMELSGMGWRKAIDQLMKREGLTLLITVRLEILPEVIENFRGHEIHVYNINESYFSWITTAMKKLVPSRNNIQLSTSAPSKNNVN